MATTEGLHPVLMRPRVEALLNDPDAKARGVWLVSGFRSIERQTELWNDAVRRYGRAGASRWVAPPGRSNHGPKVDGYGIAVDFGIRGLRSVGGQWPQATNDWFNRLARKHGLFQRMWWEDWHYEPIIGWKRTDEREEDMDGLKADERMWLEAIFNEIQRDDVDGNTHELIRNIHHHTTQDAESTLRRFIRTALKKDK